MSIHIAKFILLSLSLSPSPPPYPSLSPSIPPPPSLSIFLHLSQVPLPLPCSGHSVKDEVPLPGPAQQIVCGDNHTVILLQSGIYTQTVIPLQYCVVHVHVHCRCLHPMYMYMSIGHVHLHCTYLISNMALSIGTCMFHSLHGDIHVHVQTKPHLGVSH